MDSTNKHNLAKLLFVINYKKILFFNIKKKKKMKN